MRVLTNFPYSPFTRKAGSGQRFLQNLLILRDLGHEVTIWSTRHESNYKWLQGDFDRAKNEAINVYITDDWVLPESALCNVDLLWVNYYLMIEKFGKNDLPKVVDCHDLLSVNDQIQDLFQEHMRKIGFKNTFRFSPKIFNIPLVPNYPISEHELKAYRGCDQTIAISRKEYERLLRNNIHVQYIPYSSHCSKPIGKTYKGLPAFLGSDNLNNLFGADNLGELIVPKARLKCRNFQVQIIGELDQRCFHYPGIKYTGYQPDLQESFRDVPFMVAALVHGTGQKIKNIEALSQGIPVICFDLQKDDAPIINGETGYSVQTVDEFVERCVQLWNDRELCRRMGDNAYEIMKSFYPREKNIQDIAACLSNAVTASKIRMENIK